MTTFESWRGRLRTRKRLLKRAQQALRAARLLVTRRKAQVAEAEDKLIPLAAIEKTVRWALTQEGTTERPANSNRGPEIDKWQAAFGIIAAPWCGAFVGYALQEGGVTVTNRIVFTPFILNDAKAGRNGFEKLVKLDDCKRGDLVLMDFAPGGDPVMHVGIAIEDYKGGNVIRTVEGNTSAGAAGSQDNGGGVFVRTRPRSVIVGCARPKWPTTKEAS